MKFLATITLAALFAIPANAQQRCGPMEAMRTGLADKYGESRQNIGMLSQGRIAEMYANIETGTWTFTITTPTGTMCLMASGQSYENVTEALPSGEKT